MINSQPVRTAVHRPRLPAAPSCSAVPTTRITVYGCEPDETAAFTELAPQFGITPTITAAAPTEDNTDLAAGRRCISVGHKTKITDATLLALSRAGVQYLSTRSVGCNHIDVGYADSLGITVGTVGYSPDSVADYTVMLILMAVRHAKSTIRRADVHDYRLNALRGKELRDLTVGVVGTGRIGAAVIDRLSGFGCTVLAHDKRPKLPVDYVPLDQLLQLSDVVTLHTPLTPETHHLLDRQRIARLKRGTYLVNTGRGDSWKPRHSPEHWKVAGSAARRWMSSKGRKASSTPTAVTNRSGTRRSCGCSGCQT
jgi:D-specific alpha-keto acid dehydrogenase